mmetsp:Transcript_110771/g.278455  ORF Transcript_110771/g.278455 Transcript_110771/m.278455 type:complete len:242 (+) Transcript_110771:95-820(+)
MVIPLGPDPGALEREPVPTVIREVHAKWWWFLLFLLTCLFVLQIVSATVFPAIYTAFTAFIVWYMVRDSCKEMSSYCLLLMGMMCAIQAIFDVVILCTMLGGRREQQVTKSSYNDKTGATEYKVRYEWHPFFDESMGMTYNLQSLSRIISPIVMLIAALMAYWSHSAYETELFGEAGPIQGGGPLGYGGAGGGGSGDRRVLAGGGGGGGGGRTLGGGRGGAQAAAGFAPFGGQGQRLGNNP